MERTRLRMRYLWLWIALTALLTLGSGCEDEEWSPAIAMVNDTPFYLTVDFVSAGNITGPRLTWLVPSDGAANIGHEVFCTGEIEGECQVPYGQYSWQASTSDSTNPCGTANCLIDEGLLITVSEGLTAGITFDEILRN